MPDQRAALEEWAGILPFPVAAALWDVSTDPDDRARVEASLHFFEAAARYFTIITLSGLHADSTLYASARSSWQGRGAPPSVMMSRSTFGTWRRLFADTGRAVRRLLHDDPAAVAGAFHVRDPRRLEALCSRAV